MRHDKDEVKAGLQTLSLRERRRLFEQFVNRALEIRGDDRPLGLNALLSIKNLAPSVGLDLQMAIARGARSRTDVNAALGASDRLLLSRTPAERQLLLGTLVTRATIIRLSVSRQSALRRLREANERLPRLEQIDIDALIQWRGPRTLPQPIDRDLLNAYEVADPDRWGEIQDIRALVGLSSRPY